MKTTLVTGGTSGVGLAIARHLCHSGFRVAITSRSIEKGRMIAEVLNQETGQQFVESLAVDLSSIDSVRKAADEYKTRFSRLDVLSNNAGIVSLRRSVSEDGYEKVFATNHLGHVLLTMLLKDMLVASAPSRVISVTGNAAVLLRTRLDFDDLMLENRYSSVRASFAAALAKTLFTKQFSEEMADTGVVAHAFHPGLVKSNLSSNLPSILGLPLRVANIFMRSDCPTGEYLATDDGVGEIGGCFYENRKRVEFDHPVHGRDDQRRLYAASLELAGI